jgi:branched-subunit amino acid transport protein
MSDFLLIVIIAIGTFLLRASFMALLGDRGIPDRLKRGLRFVPVAVLPALVANPVLRPDGVLDPANPRTLAMMIAVLVALRTKSILWTIVSGLAAQAAITALL